MSDFRGYKLPEILVQNDGQVVHDIKSWETHRRPEILKLFQENVYGKQSIGKPDDLYFKVNVKEGMMDGTATRKLVEICFKGPYGEGKINLTLFIPSNVQKPVPAFLLICNRGYENIDPDRIIQSPFWSAELITSRGYAAATFHYSDADPDINDFSNGVHGIFDGPTKEREGNAWGSISAWAWGISRVIDYFETDADIDSSRIAVVGHSRGGKTALWSGALDQRIKLSVSNNSGCTGAAISRGNRGETVKQINDAFKHWFCDNYKKFNDNVDDLPIDQHMLVSLIAPRYVYVASATEDWWCDQEAEFQSCVEATSVYKLYGMEGLSTNRMPGPESPIQNEGIAYHLRTGGHNLTHYDWEQFLNYADKNL